jgi:hypothetical protein
MDEDQSRLWLRRQGIRNTQKVKTWHLKGKVSSFGILNPERRAEWAAEIRARGIGFLILDTLAPALTANGLTESNEDISAFLAAWDELCQQAGVDGSLIIHHMGLSGEHGRGASRLADWNTAEWKLVRKGQGTDSDDLFAPRYFSAYGRDIHYKEARLGFDGNTKRLIIDGGSRKDDAMEDLRPAFLDYVKINPGCVGKDLKEHLTGDDKTIRLTDQSLENRGLICIHKAGEYNTAPRHHYLVADCPDPDYHKRLKVVK